jgi:hypothetical protein
MTAAALLASGACLFRMRTVFLPGRGLHVSREYRRATLRLLCLIVPAVLVTFWALLKGVAHRDGLWGLSAAAAGNTKQAGAAASAKKQDDSSTHIGNGYESVILWPFPPKKQIVAPIQPPELLAPGTTQPLVIRFNGEYWYLQPPDIRPGPKTHHANGTPLEVHIASANSFPLLMQAHQYLRSPIRIARCRELRVDVENRETEPGSVAIAVWLKNSTTPGAPAVYLGEQPITNAGSEEIIFAVPPGSKVRSFDEISVMMLPEAGHQRVGPRVAIRQFEFVPR